MRIRSIKKLQLKYYNIIYNNYNIHFIFPSLSRITFKKVFLCKNVKM